MIEELGPASPALATASCEPSSWDVAAAHLCEAIERRAPAMAAKVSEMLYAELLGDVQAYLRDNAEWNLAHELERARKEARDVRAALHRVAAALGSRAKNYGFTLDDDKVASNAIDVVERLRAAARTMGGQDIAAYRAWLEARAEWLRKEYLNGGSYDYLRTKEDECRYVLKNLPSAAPAEAPAPVASDGDPSNSGEADGGQPNQKDPQ